MPIADIQRRLTQVGVIRLGQKVPTGRTNSRGEPGFRPAKLDRFRITSPDRRLVEAVAAKYGGTVADWRGPSGPEFEVITDVRELPVLVPPQRIDPNYELWGNGFQARMCDGITERKRAAPCLCRQGASGHVHDFEEFDGMCGCGATRECKPTTRLSVMLAEIPGLGVLKVESHGRNAAAELPMPSDALESAPGPVPARLVMRLVEKKRLTNAGKPNEKIEPRSFWVPALVFDWVTPEQAFGGQIAAAAKAALAGGVARQAIGAAPADAADDGDDEEMATRVDFYALAKLARDAATVRKLWTQAKQTGALDEALAAHLTERAAALEPKPEQAAPPAAEPAVEVLDAEVEPDRDEAWTAILREAHKAHGWNLPAVEAKYRERMGHDPNEEAATGWKYTEFLTALKAGEIR